MAYMVEKWSNERILNFLEVYEKFEVLWNIRLKGYRDRMLRDQAFELMLEELNIKNLTVDMLRSKIKVIKTVYCQELSKIIKSVKSGAGKDVYIPKLVWFDKADSFLRSVTRISILQTKELMVQKNSDEKDRVPAKRAQTSEGREIELINYGKKKVVHQAINSLEDSQEDEFDYFGKNVAAQLRTLPLSSALTCQEQIQNLLTKERLALADTTLTMKTEFTEEN